MVTESDSQTARVLHEDGSAGLRVQDHQAHAQASRALPMSDPDDWNSHRLLIMDKLDSIQTEQAEMRREYQAGQAAMGREIKALRESLTEIKVKVALWSAAVATFGTSVLHWWLQIEGAHK